MAASEVQSEAPFSAPLNCHFGCNCQLIVGNETFHLCKEVLCQLSDYFRTMLAGHFKEKNSLAIEIKDEKPQDMRYFLEAVVPHPGIRLVDDGNLQTLMRLSDKFQVLSLKQHCAGFVSNGHQRFPATKSLQILQWLNVYNFDSFPLAARALMPSVACLSLDTLDKNRESIGLSNYGLVVGAKLRALYPKTHATDAQRSHYICKGVTDMRGQPVGPDQKELYVRGCRKTVEYHDPRYHDINGCKMCLMKVSCKCVCEARFDLKTSTNECQCAKARDAYSKLLDLKL